MILETDLKQIEQLAAARHDDFEVLRYQLQFDDALDDEKLDAAVEKIAAPIRAAIDCTRCANCCRSIPIYITPQDIAILAEGLGHTEQHINQYLVENPDDKDSEMRLRSCPCPLLKDNLCTVYTHRPETCRVYPAFAPEFRWTLENTIKGAVVCPIIYHVLCEVIERLPSLYPEIST